MKLYALGRLSALTTLLVACGAEAGRGAIAEGPGCRILERQISLPAELRESSGLAASAKPDVFWTHNDGEDPGVLYAVNTAGRLLGTLRVSGAEQNDWEDIARGSCPAGTCLFIGDIGNNNVKGNEAAIFRVPEPTPGDAETRPAERFPIRYPGGARDAEALFVLPSGEVFIISKGEEHPVALYRYPGVLRVDETVELERVRNLSEGPVPREAKITGAAATPDGQWVAVRSYSELLLFRTPDLLAEGGQPALRVDLTPLAEPQGEAVSIAADRMITLTSEGGHGAPATLARLACMLPENAGDPA